MIFSIADIFRRSDITDDSAQALPVVVYSRHSVLPSYRSAVVSDGRRTGQARANPRRHFTFFHTMIHSMTGNTSDAW